MPDRLIVRLIASKDHQQDIDTLVETIRKTGTDRYDPERKQIFHDFYRNHQFDFFGTQASKESLSTQIANLKQDFATKTKGDRAEEVIPDIAIIYDASKCRMVEDVYDGTTESDCYAFLSRPIDALYDVRKI